MKKLQGACLSRKLRKLLCARCLTPGTCNCPLSSFSLSPFPLFFCLIIFSFFVPQKEIVAKIKISSDQTLYREKGGRTEIIFQGNVVFEDEEDMVYGDVLVLEGEKGRHARLFGNVQIYNEKSRTLILADRGLYDKKLKRAKFYDNVLLILSNSGVMVRAPYMERSFKDKTGLALGDVEIVKTGEYFIIAHRAWYDEKTETIILSAGVKLFRKGEKIESKRMIIKQGKIKAIGPLRGVLEE